MAGFTPKRCFGKLVPARDRLKVAGTDSQATTADVLASFCRKFYNFFELGVAFWSLHNKHLGVLIRFLDKHIISMHVCQIHSPFQIQYAAVWINSASHKHCQEA